MTIVVCKQSTPDLPAGTYEVLDERHWGFRIKVGFKTGWFDRALFTSPKKVPDED